MKIRTLDSNEWPTLAPFLHAHNVAPARCLHSHTGNTAAAYGAELATLSPDEACFIIAEPQTACVGVMGAEFSLGSRRAWLRGPVLDATLSNDVASEVRDALWGRLSAALPATIERLDGFLDVSNVTGLQWYRRCGFIEQPHYFVYEAQRGPSSPTMPDNVHAVAASQHASLLELAHLVFPSGYLTDTELTAASNDQHALFVIADGNRIDGYVYANISNANTKDAEVYVDYLVVRPEARGRKLGRTLLQAALNWGFAERDVSKAALSVASDNSNAQGLYASVGFKLLATGVPMRLDGGARSNKTTHSG